VTIGCPSFCPRGPRVAPGVARITVKNSSLDITRISVLKKSAWWTRACQLAAQSPRGEIVTAQTARGQLICFNPPRGRASDLYAYTVGGLWGNESIAANGSSVDFNRVFPYKTGT
jgi:hypothetical protein